VVSIYNKKLMI